MSLKSNEQNWKHLKCHVFLAILTSFGKLGLISDPQNFQKSQHELNYLHRTRKYNLLCSEEPGDSFPGENKKMFQYTSADFIYFLSSMPCLLPEIAEDEIVKRFYLSSDIYPGTWPSIYIIISWLLVPIFSFEYKEHLEAKTHQIRSVSKCSAKPVSRYSAKRVR